MRLPFVQIMPSPDPMLLFRPGKIDDDTTTVRVPWIGQKRERERVEYSKQDWNTIVIIITTIIE